MSSKHSKIKLLIDRTLSNSLGKQIGILGIILGVTLLLSYALLALSWDDWMKFCDRQALAPWLLPIYLLIDSNALNNLYMNGGVDGWMLLVSTLTFVCGILVFNGMLIGVITNAIDHRVADHRDGRLHYVKSGHYIIMGYDDMVPSVITEIFAKAPTADVLLLTAVDAKVVHEKLQKSVAKSKLDQIFVTYGHRMVKNDYSTIHLEAAEEIYIVGNRTRSEHDAVNVECVDSICSYLKECGAAHKPKRITCVFEDLDTYASFKTTEIFREVGDLDVEFVPYNFYAGWAKQVFMKRCYHEKSHPSDDIAYPSVYGTGITPDDKKHVHLVFVGTSNFSVAFAMEAAHLLHFPNFVKDNKLRTRITFIEQNAQDELNLFATRNRHFFEVQPYFYRDMTTDGVEHRRIDLVCKKLEHTDFLDVEFEFIKGDVYSSQVQNLISEWARDKENQYLSIFLAMADQRKNFMMGMNMPDAVYDEAIPVFIRQDRADNFVTNLRNADSADVKHYVMENGQLKEEPRKGRYAMIYPFGMDDMAYCGDNMALKQAKLINYLYCNSKDNRFPGILVLNSIDRTTLKKKADEVWKDLKVAEKWSNLYAAYSIPCKLSSLRAMRGLKANDKSLDQKALTDEEAAYLAEAEHNRWNIEKLLMGYRKARPEEDQYLYPAHKDEWKKNKKNLYIHFDIRPNKALGPVKQMDIEIVKYIPWILSTSAEI